MSIAVLLAPPVEGPLARAKRVLATRKNQAPSPGGKTDDELLAEAQEACHRRVDLQVVSSRGVQVQKDRFIFAARRLCPDADVSFLSKLADEIVTQEGDSSSRRGHENHLPLEKAKGLSVPGPEADTEESYTLDSRDAGLDRRGDMLAKLYEERGEPGGDYDSFCIGVTVKALIRGYQRVQSFAELLASHVSVPVPDKTTVIMGLRCIDGESQETTWDEAVSMWLPELIPVAIALLSRYMRIVMAEKANAGDETPPREMLLAQVPTGRRVDLEDAEAEVLHVYSVVSNADAVAQAFGKRRVTTLDFLKTRGLIDGHRGRGNKKADY